MLTIPQGLIDLARPWASLYGDSTVVSDGVTFLHFAGVFLGGGAAVTMDRETLLAGRLDDHARGHLLQRLRGIHRWVIAGLAVTFITGLLQVASDLKTFLPSGVFWLKMGLVALLLANGLLVVRGEAAAVRGRWGMLRLAAVASLSLWLVILLLGVILTSAA
ncbi:MAG TPA: hypothetical protein VFI13_01150 [Gemmatimonadales bacterium]|nr:hypothetical protein [Gemmatimonadales bacterium]